MSRKTASGSQAAKPCELVRPRFLGEALQVWVIEQAAGAGIS
jgi:hypothetical protein